MRHYFEDSFFLDGEGVFRDLTGEVVTRNVIRKMMYRHYTILVHGDSDYDDDSDECVTLLVKDEKYKTMFHLALQNTHRIKHTNQGEIKLVKERR